MQQNKLLSTVPEAVEGCKHKSETSSHQTNIKKGIVIPPPQFCPHLFTTTHKYMPFLYEEHGSFPNSYQSFPEPRNETIISPRKVLNLQALLAPRQNRIQQASYLMLHFLNAQGQGSLNSDLITPCTETYSPIDMNGREWQTCLRRQPIIPKDGAP